MTDFYDEAMKYREIARELHTVLGQTPCTCVETPEYTAFLLEQRAQREKLTTAEERLLHSILEGGAFTGEKLAKECARCVAMYKYEVAIGDDAIDLEIVKKLQNPALGLLFWEDNNG